MGFDYRDLANSLVNNKQFHLPPTDTWRMGTVAGYDPNYNYDSETGGYPALSIQLAGDERMMHGFRFSEHYVPNLGDTVWVVISPDDAWVVGSLHSHASTTGGKRSPMTLIGQASATGQTNPAIQTVILPNRLYRIEGQVNFTTSGVGTAGQVNLKVTQPGSATPLVLETRDVTGGSSYQVTGIQQWAMKDASKWANGAWTNTFPNSQYTWTLGVNSLLTSASYAAYDYTSAYTVGSIASYSGNYYQATQNLSGVWSATVRYQVGQVIVSTDNNYYVCIASNYGGTAPTATNTFWNATSIVANAAPTTPYWTQVSLPTITIANSQLSVYDMGVAT